MEQPTNTLSNMMKGASEDNAMKFPLLGWALGLSAAVVMVSICALLLSCQADCKQRTLSEEIEPQPAWVSCGISLECLT
jgi:hypothetical protein